MTAIERTIYPRFTRTPSAKEVRALYTPFPAARAFVEKHARGPAQKFSLMIMLKVYQRLHYFPDLQTIPGSVIGHIRSEMKYPDDLVPDIASATLYRYYLAIREELEIKGQSKETRRIAAATMRDAAQVMESPADLINAAIGTLLQEQYPTGCATSCKQASSIQKEEISHERVIPSHSQKEVCKYRL